MKQANNKEVDLLLRSFARGGDNAHSQIGSALGDNSVAFSNHLDADELNSYAEGVVPAPARARYIDHLADCEACRRILVGLTQAAGAAGRYEVPQEQGGANFWRKLAALFSPTVLRYAVPVLVLTAVIGIGLLALRQQRHGEFVAQNEPTNSQRSGTAVKDTGEALTPPTGATPSALPSGTQFDANSKLNKEKTNLQDQKTQVAQAPLTSTETTIAKAPATKDLAQPGEGADVATMRPYASEPKAAAPPPPPAALEVDRSELAKEREAKREEQLRSRDEFRDQRVEVHGPNRSRSNTAPSGSRGGTAGLMGARGPSVDKNKKVDLLDTRAVSGRRFAREGNVWVDTDYEPSRATIKVARGSDQFRALVADEPGIRTIADQLSGVVIVVWKNRAYRIQ